MSDEKGYALSTSVVFEDYDTAIRAFQMLNRYTLGSLYGISENLKMTVFLHAINAKPDEKVIVEMKGFDLCP